MVCMAMGMKCNTTPLQRTRRALAPEIREISQKLQVSTRIRAQAKKDESLVDNAERWELQNPIHFHYHIYLEKSFQFKFFSFKSPSNVKQLKKKKKVATC